MNFLLSILIFAANVSASTGHGGGACEGVILKTAAENRDVEHGLAIITELKGNGYEALTEQILTRKTVTFIAGLQDSKGPVASPELFWPGNYRIRVSGIDPQSQRSIWVIAQALSRIEVAARVAAQGPIERVPMRSLFSWDGRAAWSARPKSLGKYRAEQVAPVINETYRLLLELKDVNPAEVLPDQDPALWLRTLRAVAFGSPRTAPNVHDLDTHYRPEGRGPTAVKAVLYERYEREMLIAAWREQALRSAMHLAMIGAVATPLAYYGIQSLPDLPQSPAQVQMQSSDISRPPADPRMKEKVLREYQGLLNELQRRKAESIRFPNTEYINEAKQQIEDFKKSHVWIYAEVGLPRS